MEIKNKSLVRLTWIINGKVCGAYGEIDELETKQIPGEPPWLIGDVNILQDIMQPGEEDFTIDVNKKTYIKCIYPVSVNGGVLYNSQYKSICGDVIFEKKALTYDDALLKCKKFYETNKTKNHSKPGR